MFAMQTLNIVWNGIAVWRPVQRRAGKQARNKTQKLLNFALRAHISKITRLHLNSIFKLIRGGTAVNRYEATNALAVTLE
ncbi:hypothetical protein OESDEN_21736 [Oesophagostomum dentatum]|uniref:Transposase n=1 Tax=Oesophagostomum dentatum TaxID=61180 RepID=A0A0B1S461_OESDE|nr:hypothetical protein OESDEN_21736 [Oesophagostomum dentatum]